MESSEFSTVGSINQAKIKLHNLKPKLQHSIQIPLSYVSQTSPSSVSVVLPSPSSVGLAYLWNESPLLVPLGAPIYAQDQFGLPAAPFEVHLTAP